MPSSLSDFPEAFAVPIRLTHHTAWLYHLPMAPVIMKVLRPRVFVELGTHAGDSYMAFCQAAATLDPRPACTAVDTWQGDAHSGAYSHEIFAQLKAQHDPLFASFSRLLQTTFDAAAAQFADGSIDLLHIDGLHTYEAVRHDFDTWRPKLSDRAVVLFHDTAVRDAGFGVWKLWAEVSQGRPHFEVPYGFGLGMLALGENTPRPFLDFLSALNAPGQPLLPQFQALGQRLDLIRNADCYSKALAHCLTLTNNWRTLTNQPRRLENPTPQQAQAWPLQFSQITAEDVQQLAADAQSLLQEVTRLRPRTS